MAKTSTIFPTINKGSANYALKNVLVSTGDGAPNGLCKLLSHSLTLQIAWKNIAAGERKTYAEAYLLLYDRFYNYGSHLTSDISLVEDSIQEVLLLLWTSREKLYAITNPDGYFYSLFRRILFKKIKNASNQVAVEKGEWEPEFAADAIMAKKEATEELQQRLKAAIDSLTPRQKEAIYLRFYEGLSYEEVAVTLGISVKATYKIVARALLGLKEKVSLPLLCTLFSEKNGLTEIF